MMIILIDYIKFQMATIFGGSRLANLREKRTPVEEPIIKSEPIKYGLSEVETDKIGYEPSTINAGRSHTRFLKGRIDRSREAEQKGKSQYIFDHTADSFKTKPAIIQGQTGQLRLTLKDDFPKIQETKLSEQPSVKPIVKRILITKQPEKEKQFQPKTENIKNNPIVINPDAMPEKPIILNNQPNQEIKQEDAEQSTQGNQADLVQCTEGCGRKFNRKALEKHAKACKLVFMSKRKEFNSEAKRLVNKQQATIIKQAKAKQKKEGMVKNKALERTSDNWKAASKDFRAAVKAIKKDVEQESQKKDEEQEPSEEMKILPCQFCQKPFAQIFLQKHMQNCNMRKKQDDKKKIVKKK